MKGKLMKVSKMKIGSRKSLLALSAMSAAVAIGLAGCSAPGSESSPTAEVSDLITAPVTTEQVAELGDLTLSVWADQGEQDLMATFIPAYEEKYPNVTVEIQFKSYNDLTATVVNAMNSSDAPDVTQGNQGWATDGALVKAGLIRPLNDVVSAYGYEAAAGDAISQLQWSEDGSSFGAGITFGMSPDNQMVGMFYNKEKLSALGLGVPTSVAELTSALASAKAAGEIPLSLGNSDKASAMQTFSIIQGALTSATETRNWITGAEGSDFATQSNREALDTFTSWVSEGYVPAGFNGASPDDAVASFVNGDGVFFIGGSWFAGSISDSETFGFAPGLDQGGSASSGSFGLPWHVSSKSDATLAAVAFVGMLNSAEMAPQLVKVNRVPIHATSNPETGTMFADLVAASDAQLGNNGAMYWYDWATDTMFDTFTSGLQEVLAKRITSDALLERVQNDWNEFQTK
jgi:raffinose/stachyose/melibiose transport system substrate-binding protein